MLRYWMKRGAEEYGGRFQTETEKTLSNYGKLCYNLAYVMYDKIEWIDGRRTDGFLPFLCEKGRQSVFRAREYVKVKSLEEAYQLNQKKSTLVVGGMMWVKMAKFQKMTVVDLSGLGLDGIEETDEEFRIGCMCTLRDLELHPGLKAAFGMPGSGESLMKACTRHIVGVQFRNCATVGGSIFGRFGFSDVMTAMMALDTYVELYQGGIVPLAQFVDRPRDNDRLVRVIIKKDDRRAAYVSQRLSKTDFPQIAVAVSKTGDTWNVAIGARPSRARLVQVTADGPYTALAESVVSQFSFGSNLRGSGEYREALAKVYVRRLMEQIGEVE